MPRLGKRVARLGLVGTVALVALLPPSAVLAHCTSTPGWWHASGHQAITSTANATSAQIEWTNPSVCTSWDNHSIVLQPSSSSDGVIEVGWRKKSAWTAPMARRGAPVPCSDWEKCPREAFVHQPHLPPRWHNDLASPQRDPRGGAASLRGLRASRWPDH